MTNTCGSRLVATSLPAGNGPPGLIDCSVAGASYYSLASYASPTCEVNARISLVSVPLRT